MRAGVLLAMALVAGCNREPDFDERYDAASKEIGSAARSIDDELEKQAKEAETLPVQVPDPKTQQ
jgi:hypothetical protein